MFEKIRRIFYKYHYRRIPVAKKHGELIEYLNNLHNLAIRIPKKRQSYRKRIRYNLFLKSAHADELLSVSAKIEPMLSCRVNNFEYMNLYYRQPQLMNLDDFLVDQDNCPYNEDLFFDLLAQTLGPIIEHLKKLQHEDSVIGLYYERSLAFVILDWIEFLDSIIAMYLEISDEQRHTSASYFRR